MHTPTVSANPVNINGGHDRQTRWASIIDSIPLILTLVSGLICYGLFVRRGIWLSVVGYSISPAERVLLGEVPYRDFLYNYTPGTLWLNALLMKLFGPSLITINVGLLAFKLLTLVTLFLLGRWLVGRWVALLPVGLTLAWLGHRYIYGAVPTQYSLLFALLSLASMLKFDRGGRSYWLFISGVSAGAVLVFKYNVGIALLGCGSLVIGARELALSDGAHGWSEKFLASLRKASVYWAGFGTPVLLMFAYLAYNDALGPMVNHFLHHAAEYSEVRSVGLPGPKLLIPALIGLVLAMAGGFAVLRWLPKYLFLYSLLILGIVCSAIIVPGRAYLVKTSAQASVAYLPIGLFVVTAFVVLWPLKNSRGSIEGLQQWWKQKASLLIVTLFAIGVYLEMYPRADDYHLVRVLPVIFLLMIMLVAHSWSGIGNFLSRSIGDYKRIRLAIAALPVTLLVTVGVYQTWRPHFVAGGFSDRVPLALSRATGILVSPRQAHFIGGLAQVIEENSSPGDSIFSFAQRGSGFYFLTGRRNPTRFVWWRSVGIDSEDRQAVLDMIGNRIPKLILLQDSLSNQPVRETVTTNYRRVTSVNDIGVYERNE